MSEVEKRKVPTPELKAKIGLEAILNGYANMGELMLAVTEYMTFYNRSASTRRSATTRQARSTRRAPAVAP